MPVLISFVAGSIFGVGLILSGMTNPNVVLAFLDPLGDWNPSLALVMGGAVAIASASFAVARNRTVSLSGAPMHMPVAQRIDRPLVVGSTMFGIGWGLAGLCPGPVIVIVGRCEVKAMVFAAAMLGGMGLFEVSRRLTPR